MLILGGDHCGSHFSTFQANSSGVYYITVHTQLVPVVHAINVITPLTNFYIVTAKSLYSCSLTQNVGNKQYFCFLMFIALNYTKSTHVTIPSVSFTTLI